MKKDGCSRTRCKMTAGHSGSRVSLNPTESDLSTIPIIFATCDVANCRSQRFIVKKLAAHKQSENAFPKRLSIRLDALSGQNLLIVVAEAVAAVPVVSHPPAEACRPLATKFRRGLTAAGLNYYSTISLDEALE